MAKVINTQEAFSFCETIQQTNHQEFTRYGLMLALRDLEKISQETDIFDALMYTEILASIFQDQLFKDLVEQESLKEMLSRGIVI